jgi:hypothetical protein
MARSTEIHHQHRVDFNSMNAFCSHVKQCGLFDVGFSGPAYTWSNKRFFHAYL